jgi:hypothetical protein
MSSSLSDSDFPKDGKSPLGSHETARSHPGPTLDVPASKKPLVGTFEKTFSPEGSGLSTPAEVMIIRPLSSGGFSREPEKSNDAINSDVEKCPGKLGLKLNLRE